MITCPRCKGTNTKKQPQQTGNGIHAYCHPCRRAFVQGGTVDIDLNLPVLQERIDRTTIDVELRQELLHDAVERILKGEGSCATIDLRKQSNRKMLYGRWGQQGSDSNAMRALNGQKLEYS